MKILVIVEIDPDKVLDQAKDTPYEYNIGDATNYCISTGKLDDISVWKTIEPDELDPNDSTLGRYIRERMNN